LVVSTFSISFIIFSCTFALTLSLENCSSNISSNSQVSFIQKSFNCFLAIALSLLVAVKFSTLVEKSDIILFIA
jgi:hypothetical protein